MQPPFTRGDQVQYCHNGSPIGAIGTVSVLAIANGEWWCTVQLPASAATEIIAAENLILATYPDGTVMQRLDVRSDTETLPEYTPGTPNNPARSKSWPTANTPSKSIGNRP